MERIREIKIEIFLWTSNCKIKREKLLYGYMKLYFIVKICEYKYSAV